MEHVSEYITLQSLKRGPLRPLCPFCSSQKITFTPARTALHCRHCGCVFKPNEIVGWGMSDDGEDMRCTEDAAPYVRDVGPRYDSKPTQPRED